MNKKTKIWLIIATSLIFVGCIIFGSVMTMLNWDFTKLLTVKYETNDYSINEEYKNISINTKSADVLFVPSETSQTSVVCYEQKNMKHSVAVENGTLVINIADERKWYEYIGVNLGTPKITVYIPQTVYGALSIKASTGDVSIKNDFGFESIDISLSTGDINIKNLTAKTLDLSLTTGEITVSNVNCEGDFTVNVTTGDVDITDTTCKNLKSKGSTGDISLKNVIASETFSIERSTGDVEFEKSDAEELYVITDTGDVEGSLLSEKVFITRTDTGNIEVPKSTNGGRCEITTDTGDIEIDIK